MTSKRTALPFIDWPECDQDLWISANSTGKFLEPDGKAAHWKEKTRIGVMKRYSLWLGYLASTDLLNDASKPSARIIKDTLTGYVRWLEARSNASTTISSCVRDLREALRVMEPDSNLSLITELAKTLHAREKPVRAKHTKIMHPDELLSGALSFLDDVPDTKFRNKACQAGKYRDGLIVAFLACRPIRLENITTIFMGQHLTLHDERWHCSFGADEMKDNCPLAFSLPDLLASYLETYIDTYRPILLKGNKSCDLWISTRGRRMSEQSVYWNTCRLTEELFNQRINPHLFRDCAASALATKDPEHILAIARILGHTSITTTQRHYNQSQMTAAADILHNALADIKNQPDDDQHWSEVEIY
jgi:integrase/recombinase XerD